MSSFQTNDILNCWHQRLIELFGGNCHRIERESVYINKPMPFKALNMGKKDDEYFLDVNNRRISVGELLENLNLLVIKEFQDYRDLSIDDKQASIANSRADIYIEFESAQFIIELEVFKDKPFSNLIYMPEFCSQDVAKPLYFIHCFAPERLDKEAELTRKIGNWLENQPFVKHYKYLSYIMPSLQEPIKYLLPKKKMIKPKSYLFDDDRVKFHQYAITFCDDVIYPKVKSILASFS
jgi:hypothetical protein